MLSEYFSECFGIGVVKMIMRQYQNVGSYVENAFVCRLPALVLWIDLFYAVRQIRVDHNGHTVKIEKQPCLT